VDRLRGVIAPILTPFDNDGTIAGDLWSAHARWLLDQGAHYLSPFGTTGEALSVSISARMAALAGLIEAGISAENLMPGTGLSSLDDTVALTRHAVDLGVAAVLVLPPFFYPDASDDGLFRYFAELIEGVGDARLKICLYNIPQNTGVAISPDLAARLNREFPEVIVAYKDSTGNWDNTIAVIRAAPQLAVFPGTEALMAQAMAEGGAGCVSASVNLNAGAIRAVYDAAPAQEGGDVGINRFRNIIQRAGLIRAMKSVLAVRGSDARWLNLRPPLLNGSMEMGHSILAELGPFSAHLSARPR